MNLKLDTWFHPGQGADDFIGFGYETSAVAVPGYFSKTNLHLIDLYRTLSPSGLIRIGGNVSDHTGLCPGRQGGRRIRKPLSPGSTKPRSGNLAASPWRRAGKCSGD